MKTKSARLPIVFAFVMLAFVAFLLWYLPAMKERQFVLEDVRKSIETSQGRERKQQYEYDETVSAIPQVQAELDRISPLNDSLTLEVNTLKEERKRLRQEKKDLESRSDTSVQQEVTDGE